MSQLDIAGTADRSEGLVALVRYSIVSIERDRERVLVCDACRVVTEPMSDCQFETWVVSDYCQQTSLSTAETKSLRVAYTVLACWKKRPLDFESSQLDRLSSIARAIRGCCDETSSKSQDEMARANPPGSQVVPPPDEASGSPAEPSTLTVLGDGERELARVLIKLGGEAAMGELRRETGLGRPAVAAQLARLMEVGLVRRVGTGFNTRYQVVDA